MDNLNSTLSSILSDPQKIEQLRQVAQSLGINPPSGQEQPAAPSGGGIDPAVIASALKNFQQAPAAGAPAQQQPAGTSSPGSLEAITKIAGIFGSMNQSDKNVELLRALKPHFSPERAGRIDDAVRIMMLLKAWPALRDSGLLGSLGNLFTGGGGK